MDDVDRRIVSLLRANGRASYAELARTVGLSAPSVHERVAKLEADEDLVEGLRRMPEITDCFYVAGEEAFLLRVRVADIAALERVTAAISRIRGVSRTRTTVVLSSRWEDRNV